MYLIVLLAGLGIPTTLGAAVMTFILRRGSRAPLVVSTLPAALGLLVILTGYVGMQVGLAQMEKALTLVNPADVETIRAAGQSEARVAWIFGLMVGGPMIAVSLALLGVALSKLRPAPAGAPTGP